MLIRDLAFDECVQVLRRNSICHLACAKDGQPYVVPIHYSFDAEQHTIYLLSTGGQKVEWMRANPRVCVAVDEISDKNHWTTVILNGVYEELSNRDDTSDARQRPHQLFQERKEWWLPALAKHSRDTSYEVVIFQIRIDRMTGRRSRRSDIAESV